MSFSEGEIIILKEYVNEEWARGEVRGRTGIFPLNFVEPVEDSPTSGANVLSEYREFFFIMSCPNSNKPNNSIIFQLYNNPYCHIFKVEGKLILK